MLAFFNVIFLFVYVLVCTLRYSPSLYGRLLPGWFRFEDLVIVGTFTIGVYIVDLLALSLRESQNWY